MVPVINQMAENTDYDGLILVPITDGKRVFNIRTDLRTAVRTELLLGVLEVENYVLDGIIKHVDDIHAYALAKHGE